jgi:uncharacterized protein (TIGR02646 family)
MIKLNRPSCPYPKALINKDYKHPKNKEALKNASHDKCMYCESKISHIDFAHVEHIKPKAADKFPHLEFDWANHGYVCPKCNNAKSDKYFDGLEFIDPYSEDPDEHLCVFGAMIFNKRGSERGEITIREIELNRAELFEKRTGRISDIQKALEACFRTQSPVLRDLAIDELKKEADNDKEYSIFVKALLAANEL